MKLRVLPLLDEDETEVLPVSVSINGHETTVTGPSVLEVKPIDPPTVLTPGPAPSDPNAPPAAAPHLP